MQDSYFSILSSIILCPSFSPILYCTVYIYLILALRNQIVKTLRKYQERANDFVSCRVLSMGSVQCTFFPWVLYSVHYFHVLCTVYISFMGSVQCTIFSWVLYTVSILFMSSVQCTLFSFVLYCVHSFHGFCTVYIIFMCSVQCTFFSWVLYTVYFLFMGSGQSLGVWN